MLFLLPGQAQRADELRVLKGDPFQLAGFEIKLGLEGEIKSRDPT